MRAAFARFGSRERHARLVLVEYMRHLADAKTVDGHGDVRVRQGYAVCPTLDLLHLLGKKWTIPVLQELYYSRAMLSFNYLGNTISGATQRNLSLSLKELQDAGLIRKTESVIGRAKHTGYAITERGRALINVINAVKQLGVSWYGMDPRCKNFNCASCEFFAADRCVVRPTQQTDSIVVQLRDCESFINSTT